MTVRIAGLEVDEALAAFVADELLPGLNIDAGAWWTRLGELQERFAGRIRVLLERRDDLQAELDEWYAAHSAATPEDTEAFLERIGYLVRVPDVQVDVHGVDDEIARIAGPQLVVPATVPRYALNAANARWGSLFDALYGTDVLPLDHELAAGYDEARGAQVIEAADGLLDELFPLAGASHAEVSEYAVVGGELVARTPGGSVRLADPAQFAGQAEGAVLLVRHGLHAELRIDREHPVGRTHHAGVADVLLEAAVTTIVDLEDSVSTVDGEDKASAYRTWLGLMTGELSAEFEKGGRTVVRSAHGDRRYAAPDGSKLVLPGRSLLLARTVGHHMFCDAVRGRDGEPVAEGVLDALVVATAALYDLRGLGRFRNSRAGSVYVVKPKQHGPEEVALTVELFGAVEEALGLPERTIKIGIMDEEKRTSLNLEACVAAASDRVIFINTGFLDRTGDEIHSDFRAGALVRKNDMKSTVWLNAYEDRNVEVALAAGFRGQAQVGKGMWAKPAAMADLLEQKVAHPLAGANCAWVPSPTAATLHAIHYLRVDVAQRQAALAGRRTDRRLLLEVPLLERELSAEEVDHELRTNAQSILGYVVRWVGMGVGCSTVPDLEGVGLMEDRATLRISSQLIANWLHHGLVDEDRVRRTFAEMAALVDAQNAGEPGYSPMCTDLAASESFQAALELVFTGRDEPNGYTERALTKWRRQAKAR
ncbi:MAG: malate synthase G [Propionicimonas sp.]|uniref:malate synthase G n=1 Tax=Propionicimonas sp. TaxID=1955623 RepID=UPI003D0AABDC